MFPASIYIQRRQKLAQSVQSGVILFLGNDDSPRNYHDNVYPFRQDSSFLYYWGLNCPDLAAVIDVDQGRETVFGSDRSADEAIWCGQQDSLREAAKAAGIGHVKAFHEIEALLQKALEGHRRVHFLPQYRPSNRLKIHQWMGLPPNRVQELASPALIRAVVAQRSVKAAEEIHEIENALSITYAMHLRAMQMTAPGVYELEVVGAMESTAYASGGSRMAYPPIFTVRGEILHNRFHTNRMQAGDLAVNDAGAESARQYASDITRTIPVSGKFDSRQKEIYGIVLNAQQAAIRAMQPDVEYREIHQLACRVMTEGMQQTGFMKGEIDASVREGAHALFFPHGIGHMLGLDVHDMEALGEDQVGYTDQIRRAEQFGLSNLRFAKALQAGYVMSVEPGIYFIPQLIDRWKAEKKHEAFIRYEAFDTFRDFGGIRIEDDVLVTEGGCRLLGKPIAKTVAEIESICG